MHSRRIAPEAKEPFMSDCANFSMWTPGKDLVPNKNHTMVKEAISIHSLDVEVDLVEVFQLLRKLFTNDIIKAHPPFESLKKSYTTILASGIATIDLVYGNHKLLFLVEAFQALKYDTGSLLAQEGDFCLQFLFDEEALGGTILFEKGLSTILAHYFRERKMKRVMVDVAYSLNVPLLPLLITAGFKPTYQTTETRKIFYWCTWDSWQPFIY